MMKKRLWSIIIPLIALLLIGIIVLLERSGVEKRRTYISDKDFVYSEAVNSDVECLVVINKNESVSKEYSDELNVVLGGMKIKYEVIDASDFGNSNNNIADSIRTIIIATPNWQPLGKGVFDIIDWVENGGNLMVLSAPYIDSVFNAISRKLGIISLEEGTATFRGMIISEDFMIGADSSKAYPLLEEEENAIGGSNSVQLDDRCVVDVYDENETIPLIWHRELGKGNSCIFNFSIVEKISRGFWAAAYSMLDDVCIYPVIDASAYYLDDFPSPVPKGDGEYIERDYGTSIASFYSAIWLPRVLGWEEKYGIYHTGMIIEQYSDDVDPPFDTNESVTQMATFGNMILNNGGELGFHGYNHMPLCEEGTEDYMKYGSYNLWPSVEAMGEALTELNNFSSKLFEDETFSVYVPPSNIMADKGKEALLTYTPSIKVIASTYLKDAEVNTLTQEFEVEDNGIIDTPRVTSGCNIGLYERWAALSELNFHFVQSHFMHPDDCLDEDRGADLGWEALASEFEKYLDWVKESAPGIRNVTGSGMGKAVSDYSNLSVQRTYEEDGISLNLGGFSKEAFFLMRVNNGKIVSVENGDYSNVCSNIYLIHAKKDHIRVYTGE